MSVSLLQSNLKVTGSTTIYSPNLSGIGGTIILRSGDFVLISGGVSSGGGGTTIITGGPTNISGLISTGQADLRYYPLLSNPSGYITSGQTGQFYSTSNLLGFATSGNLASTGQSAWLAAQNNAINLSGNLLLTGQRIWGDSNNNALNLSGNLLNVSGVLASQIAGASAGVSTLNGFSGSIQVLPTGQNITIQSTGFKIYIGATGFITSGDLLNSISGFIQTGNADLRYYAISNPAQFVTTGNLYLTGSNLDGKINALSGLLTATGALVLNISGGLDVRIRATGQAAWISANGAASGLSGNLNASGRRAWDDAINLSGRLVATGALISNISGWSDFTFVHKTGNESINGEKYFLNNIGVGTSSPIRRLEVIGSGGGGIYIREDAPNRTMEIDSYRISGPYFSISTSGVAYSDIGAGKAVLGGPLSPTSLAISTRNQVDNLYLGAGALAVMVITGNGSVGIGVSTPTSKLDVGGDARIRGNITGDAGYYDSAATTKTANYSITQNDYRIYCNNTNPITLTFPNAVSALGQSINIKLLNTGAVYFTGIFGQKFDGSDLYVAVGQYNTYSLHAFANNWNLW